MGCCASKEANTTASGMQRKRSRSSSMKATPEQIVDDGFLEWSSMTFKRNVNSLGDTARQVSLEEGLRGYSWEIGKALAGQEILLVSLLIGGRRVTPELKEKRKSAQKALEANGQQSANPLEGNSQHPDEGNGHSNGNRDGQFSPSEAEGNHDNEQRSGEQKAASAPTVKTWEKEAQKAEAEVAIAFHQGFQSKTALGNEDDQEKAEKAMKNAVRGLFVATLASTGPEQFILKDAGSAVEDALPPWSIVQVEALADSPLADSKDPLMHQLVMVKVSCKDVLITDNDKYEELGMYLCIHSRAARGKDGAPVAGTEQIPPAKWAQRLDGVVEGVSALVRRGRDTS